MKKENKSIEMPKINFKFQNSMAQTCFIIYSSDVLRNAALNIISDFRKSS